LEKRSGLAYLTAGEVADADRAATEEYGVSVTSLMENAGVAVATVAKELLGGNAGGRTVCVLAGKGNNGGDGLVAARHLRSWGAEVEVVIAGDRSDLREVPAKQAEAAEGMGIPFFGPGRDFDAQLIIDSLLGYGSTGNPREPVARLIRRANSKKRSVLAVDIPSGLDATTGAPGEPCIVANATVTFGFPKTGFLNPDSRRFVGDLFLADISLPAEIYARYSVNSGLFAERAIVRVDVGANAFEPSRGDRPRR